MRIIVIILFFVAANVCLVGAPAKEPKSDLKPGVHAGQKCVDSAYTYDLYVPKAYAEDKESPFPAVFIQGSGLRRAKQFFNELKGWADEESVLLITLNDSRNHLPDADYPKIQRSVVESVDKQCRLHPYLRFSIGGSGGAMASLSLALEYPKDWAGIVVMIHSGNGLIAPKGCAVSFLAGEKDTTHGIKWVWEAYHKTKANGNPVRIKVFPEMGHGQIPPVDKKRELSWMLGLMKLAHPKVTAKERKALIPLVEKRIANLASIEDAAERASEVAVLLDVPWIQSMRSYSTVIGHWFDIKFPEIEKIENPVKRWMAMGQLGNHKAAKKFSMKQRRALSTALRKLERDKDVANEKAAQARLTIIVKKDDGYRKRKKMDYRTTMKLQKDYDGFIKRYEGTLAANTAKMRRDSLPKWVVR